MNRIIFLIDGFNFYHAIADNAKYRKYKWVDFSKLARCYITKNDSLKGIYYFTALAAWLPDSYRRHKIFIRALELKGTKVVYGEFKRKDKLCNLCKKRYQTYEEKQTDVNIAIHLLGLAAQDEYDTAIIISADSDLIPAINAVRKTFPSKKIGLVIPIGRPAESLKQSVDFHMKMKERHLSTSLLERGISLENNQKLTCPPEWHS